MNIRSHHARPRFLMQGMPALDRPQALEVIAAVHAEAPAGGALTTAGRIHFAGHETDSRGI